MHWLGLVQECQLVCQAMHWRDSSECQGCTGSTSITCVHRAVARNSLTYLTALETPDRSQTDTPVKAQLKTQPAHRDAAEDTDRSRSLALMHQRQQLQQQRKLCKALSGLHTQVPSSAITNLKGLNISI